MTVLFGLLASAAPASAQGVPLPAPPSLGGPGVLSAGVGLWQAPTVGHNAPNLWGRANGHVTAMAHLGPLVSAGLHLAAWSVPYAPVRGLRTSGARVEPRFGVRVAMRRRARVDLNLGIALDISGEILVGPVLSGTGRFWPGERPGVGLFLLAEARLAPAVTFAHVDVDCGPAWCDNALTYDPGGTGVLVGAGWSIR